MKNKKRRLYINKDEQKLLFYMAIQSAKNLESIRVERNQLELKDADLGGSDIWSRDEVSKLYRKLLGKIIGLD